MCDCDKPSTTEAKTSHDSKGANAPVAEKAHAHHAAHAAADASTDAACTCGPSGTGDHATHADAATPA